MHLVGTSLSSYEEDGVTLNLPSIAILPRFLANFVTFFTFFGKNCSWNHPGGVRVTKWGIGGRLQKFFLR